MNFVTASLGRAGALRSPLLGVADQFVSSFSNLLLAAFVANYSSRVEFGQFGVAVAIYFAAVTLTRGVVGGVVALKLSTMTDAVFPGEAAIAAGTASLLGIAIGAGVASTCLFLNSGLASMILIIACALPVLILQDSLRFIAFAVRRPLCALGNDATWLAVQALAFTALILARVASAQTLVAAWALASLAGCIVAGRGLGLRPNLMAPHYWLSTHRSLIRSLSTENLFIAGVAQGAPLLIGVISGISSVGDMRAAQTAFGPVTAVNSGLGIAIVPPAARKWAEGNPSFLRALIVNACVLMTWSVTWGVALLILPVEIGRQLLGEHWGAVRTLALPTALWLGLGYLSVPAIAGMRIIGSNWTSARARAILSPIILALAGSGAVAGAALGATLFLSLANLLAGLVMWYLFLKAYRRDIEALPPKVGVVSG